MSRMIPGIIIESSSSPNNGFLNLNSIFAKANAEIAEEKMPTTVTGMAMMRVFFKPVSTMLSPVRKIVYDVNTRP